MKTDSFGTYLVSENIITREELNQAIRMQYARSDVLQDLSIRLQFLDYDDVRRIKREQDRLEIDFGESAQSLNLLSESQFQYLLLTLFNNHIYLSNAAMSYSHLGESKISEYLHEYLKLVTHQNQAAQSTTDDLCPGVSQSVVNLITRYFYRDGCAVHAKTTELHHVDAGQHEIYAAEHKYRRSGSCYLSFLLPQSLNQLLAHTWYGEYQGEKHKRDAWDIVSENLFNLNYTFCRNLRKIGYKAKHGTIQNVLPEHTKNLCIKFDSFIGSFYAVYSNAS